MEQELTEIEKKLTKIYDFTIGMKEPQIRKFVDSDFNCYIVTGFLSGASIKMKVGKVVQVREEAGAFGSDTVLIRNCDGLLIPHENQSFYKVPHYAIKKSDEVFKDVFLDIINTPYNLSGEFEEIGFIIKSKASDGE